jgi:hypothetical protein
VICETEQAPEQQVSTMPVAGSKPRGVQGQAGLEPLHAPAAVCLELAGVAIRGAEDHLKDT